MQLAVADVERDHARRAALQEHVREAARRGADVEAVEPADVDRERVERVRELVPGPRDVRRRLLDLERDVVRHLLARLRVSRDESGHHERLRLGARLGEPALDEQDVKPLARCLHAVRAANPSRFPRAPRSRPGSTPAAPARGRPRRRPAGVRLLADVEHRAVAVEQVVDQLEQRPQLDRERAPGRLLAGRHLGRRRPHITEASNSAPVFSRLTRSRSGAPSRSSCWPPIIPSVASTSSCATAVVRTRAQARTASREQRVAGQHRRRLAVAAAHVEGGPAARRRRRAQAGRRGRART